ncbi:hypothetical protein VNO78_12418 [Psophocarpus tetragonolobus]|uniref:Uncharacterized protein n=1 Tax=Psophocarpus tetragonolobus TaxID=3891 RepID=A0AAN9SVI6_PSOTE
MLCYSTFIFFGIIMNLEQLDPFVFFYMWVAMANAVNIYILCLIVSMIILNPMLEFKSAECSYAYTLKKMENGVVGRVKPGTYFSFRGTSRKYKRDPIVPLSDSRLKVNVQDGIVAEKHKQKRDSGLNLLLQILLQIITLCGFLEILKRLQINIPFIEAMEQMPTYVKFMKELLTKKRRLSETETVELEVGCSAIIQRSLPQKSRDLGSFTLPVTIGKLSIGKALLDLGSSINLMPLSMLRRIVDVEVRPIRMTLQLANRSVKYPHRIVEDLLVKVDKFMFPLDFVVMDMEEDSDVPLILGRPFMKTARVIIDVDDGNLKVRVQDDEVNLDVFEAMKHPSDKKECFRIDVLDEIYMEAQGSCSKTDSLEKALVGYINKVDIDNDKQIQKCLKELDKSKEIPLDVPKEELKKEESSDLSKLELKQLPSHLKYVFLGKNGGKHVIISSSLTEKEEQKFIEVLKSNSGATGWTLCDLKGINPSYCMHKILMEQDYKLVAQPQRRLNPTMKEVVRKEVIKLLEAGMIYPISDSAWVSPVQVVPKRGGMTVMLERCPSEVLMRSQPPKREKDKLPPNNLRLNHRKHPLPFNWTDLNFRKKLSNNGNPGCVTPLFTIDRDAINDFLGGNFILGEDSLDTFTRLKKNMHLLPYVLVDKLCLPGRSYEVRRTGNLVSFLRKDVKTLVKIWQNFINYNIMPLTHISDINIPGQKSGVSKPLAFPGLIMELIKAKKIKIPSHSSRPLRPPINAFYIITHCINLEEGVQGLQPLRQPRRGPPRQDYSDLTTTIQHLG